MKSHPEALEPWELLGTIVKNFIKDIDQDE
jgi:hypothetical protein